QIGAVEAANMHPGRPSWQQRKNDSPSAPASQQTFPWSTPTFVVRRQLMLRRIAAISAVRKVRSSKGATALAIAIVIAVFIKTVVAVHDTGQFQLDGDASSLTNTVGTPPAVDDWDKICNE